MPSITSPGYRDPTIASPGSQDMIPISQHSPVDAAAGGSFMDFDSSILKGLFGAFDIKKSKVDPFLQAALGTQLGIGQELISSLEGYGAGARAQVDQDFQTRYNNLLGQMEARGLGASSGVVAGGMGLERERQLALGGINDQIIGRRLELLSGIGGGVVDIFSAAANRSFEEKLLNKQLEAQTGGGTFGGGPLKRV